MSRLVFINLPVADVARSKAFFGGLGFGFDPKFTDDSAACMVISEGASYAMLVERSRFGDFAVKPIADGSTTEALICVSAEDRAAVDTLADAALADGATKAQEPTEMDFMYGRSFIDPDGHHWEVMWMSQEAIEQGPADMAPASA